MTAPLDQIRARCLALPDAHEVEVGGELSFRVRNKLFAMVASPHNHHNAGRWAVWLHCAAENQCAIMALDPSRYFSPPYVGKSGWVGVWIDKRPRWRDVDPLFRDAYGRGTEDAGRAAGGLRRNAENDLGALSETPLAAREGR